MVTTMGIKKQTSKHSRSRNGCLECRKSRKACDEKKPTCSRCQRQNVKCLYQLSLRFKDDLELKGAVFGREGVWSKNKSLAKKTNDLSDIAAGHKHLHHYVYPGRLYFINVTSDNLISSPRLLGSIYPKGNPLFIDADGSSNFALSFYIQRVSPIFNPIKSLNANGLDFSTLIQFSHNGANHVLTMLLAIGSSYLIRQDNDYWRRKAVYYKQLAMQEIKERLKCCTSDVMNYELLLSSLLLCLYDLANDCNDDWDKHIIIAKWLLNHFSFSSENDVEFKILQFTSDFFGYQEAMGRTACRKLSVFNSEDWEQDSSLISWMGCNRKLVSTISDITDLSYERTSMNPQDFHILTDRIENSLDEQLLTSQISNDETSCFLLGCECKKLATKIYLHCSLLNKTPKDHMIVELVSNLANFLEFIIIENNFCWSFLIWPTFIMGTQIDPLSSNCEELRALTLDLFNYLEFNSLGNVNKSREIILNIWNKRDLDAPISKEYENDWDIYVADKDLNISLA